ncbi:MAG: histidinol-phosphate aminotransferase family protein [Calditrichaeota bacterium]|nr:histidinol-phosphate aminotransferase family protein [Calditrichota bacterium]
MKTVYLDRNESQYGPSPKCFEALHNIGIEHLSQYTRDYARGVKSRVSEKLAAWLGLEEKHILLSYGSEGLLKYAVHKFVPKNGTLMVPDKSWWYYGAIANEVGGKSVTYEIKDIGDRFVYDLDEMKRVYDENQPHAIFIASPNNPTGNSISTEDLVEILGYFKNSKVIIDEAYWGFNSLDNTHIKKLIEANPNLLIFRTFSKYFALAGLRFGYGICSDAFADFATYTTRYLGYSPLIEDLALAALNDLDYYAEINKKYTSDKDLYYKTLADYDFITCYKSDCNFLFIKMHPNMIEPLKKGLEPTGLKVKFFDDDIFQDSIRLSLGTQEQGQIVLNEIVKATKFV